MRLTDLERQKLQLIVSALKVSEYTDEVDGYRRMDPNERRMEKAMREFFDTVTGLAIASDVVPRSVKDALLAGETHLSTIVPLLEELFEILRRHKRLNPTVHYGEYGKLIMMLQDIQRKSLRLALGFGDAVLIKPLQTVGSVLEGIGCGSLLSDGELESAYLSRSGSEKQDGLKLLLDKYDGGVPGNRATVEHCLRSMDDVRELLVTNVNPLIYLQNIVRRHFKPMSESDKYNIAIYAGRGGAQFTHNHATHCQYVLESLLLWEKVQMRIFDIWDAAEDDMIIDSAGRYEFTNTGQGYHRLCWAPKSYAIMSRCVRDTEVEMGGWIGIKVIHLGDRDVPNPLVFIDKYTLIPRIVQPVVSTIFALKHIMSGAEPKEAEDVYDTQHHVSYPGIHDMLRRRYNVYRDLQFAILSDFFKHAFDGSGDDGGSCIDGRLTSAWNWCHRISKKSYYDAFVLSGFNGFD